MLRTTAAPGVALGLVVRLTFSVEEHVTKVSDPAAEGSWRAQLVSVPEEIYGVFARTREESDFSEARMRGDEIVVEAKQEVLK